MVFSHLFEKNLVFMSYFWKTVFGELHFEELMRLLSSLLAFRMRFWDLYRSRGVWRQWPWWKGGGGLRVKGMGPQTREKRFYWDYTFISEICIDKLIMYFLIEYDGIVLYLGFKVEVSSKKTYRAYKFN